MVRTYTELCQLQTLEERYDYLRLNGTVADPTFDDMRWLNQRFYKSREWRQLRDEIIARDYGFDLGVEGVAIKGRYPVIHHMNPITEKDILEGTDNLLSPEFLITMSLTSHNAVHYGDESQLPRVFVEREPGDHISWKKGFDLDALRAADHAIRGGQASRW